MEARMTSPYRRFVTFAVIMGLVACGRGVGTSSSPSADPSTGLTASPTANGTDAPEPSAGPIDILKVEEFASLSPGTYSIDPDGDPSTPVKLLFTIADPGWNQWIGAFKEEEGGRGRSVSVSITTVDNLVEHACDDHLPAEPPVGPGVVDLANALADLRPFEVAESPTDVTIVGFDGKHLTLTVPDLPGEFRGGQMVFTDCQAEGLKSWISPLLSFAYYGYVAPGEIEELWILDVEGERVLIAANYHPESPAQDVAAMRGILDSIQRRW